MSMEIVSYPDLSSIEGLLECPCCLDPPVPPITCCTSGHIICSICKPRLTRCALCREKYTDTRNLALESIFQACKFKCRYQYCPYISLGSGYPQHLRCCSFRCINCLQCRKEIPVSKYIAHLKETHTAFGYDEEEKQYDHSQSASDLFEERRFPDEFAFSNGKWFVVSVLLKCGYLYIWISLVQVEEVQNSSFLATITMSAGENSYPRVEWTIPVDVIQNGEPNFRHCVTIPIYPTLQAFLCKEDFIYSWKYSYNIQGYPELPE